MARSSVTIPFVAREPEVARAAAALERARAGEPSLLLVAGDAGVGKTRFLEHVAELARASGARVVAGHCVDLGEIGLPYLPLTEALAALQRLDPTTVEAVTAEHPALCRLLPGSGSAADEDADRRRLFEGIAEVLAAAGSRQQPLLLILEDLHWADASSRDVLRFLVARMTDQHLVVVASYRSDDLHRRHPWRAVAAELGRHPRVERIDLAPFTRDELGEFAMKVVGRPLTATTLEKVRIRSEGNAYFAVEILEAGPDDDELPWSLADVLRTRLDPLEPSVHHLVQVAAVAGRRVAEPLLRAAVAANGNPDLDVDAALREAVAHNVLREEDGQIAFRHALLAEVVYGDLLPGEKSSLHRAYLSALQDDPSLGSAAELASHALLAPDLDVALRASWVAAEAAAEMLAPQERLRHLEVALRLWDAVPDTAAMIGVDRIGVVEAAARAAVDAGAIEHGVALLRSAIEEAAGDAHRRAVLRIVLTRALLGLERPREARLEIVAALADLREPDADRARALAAGARVALDSDLDEEAAAVAAEAVDLARGVGAADAESDGLTTLAVLDQQSPQQTERLLRTALERAQQSGDGVTELRTRFNLASSRFYAGDVAGAGQLTAESLTRADGLGLTWSSYGIALQWLAEVARYTAGDLSATPLRTAPQGLETALEAVSAVRLYAAAARGDADVVERGIALMGEWRRDPLILHAAGGATVDALTWGGRYDEAVARGARVLDDLSRTWSENFLGGIWHCALALTALADAAEDERLHGRDPAARVGAGDGFVKRARTTAEQGRPRGGALGPEGRAWLARAEAEHARLLGHDDPALWEAVVDEFSGGFRYEAARSRWRWAAALVGAGDRAGAREQAGRALAEAEEMGARPLAEAVRGLARRARLDLPGVRLVGADVLTAREAEVLGLVAQGLTNRQIGERLFVSDKTVSVHVSNVLAKLAVSSRAEAVSVAHQRGLLSPQ